MSLAQRENCAVPNKKLFGPMVHHMSLSKTLPQEQCDSHDQSISPNPTCIPFFVPLSVARFEIALLHTHVHVLYMVSTINITFVCVYKSLHVHTFCICCVDNNKRVLWNSDEYLKFYNNSFFANLHVIELYFETVLSILLFFNVIVYV